MKKLIFLIGFFLLIGNAYPQWVYQNNPDSISTISSGSFINSNTGWYARSKGEISKTTDGGISWSTFKVTNVDLSSIKFVNENTGYLCGNSGRLMKSTNGGLNWSIQNPSVADTLVSIDFVNENTGWCAGRDFIIFTTSGGAQWYRQNVDTNTVKPRFTVLKMYDSQIGLAGAYSKHYVSGDYAYIYRTSNGGINWGFIDSVSGYRISSICYVNQNIVYMSSYFYLLKSLNGGLNWNLVSNFGGLYFPKIQFINENTGWVVKWQSIFKTYNGGINWVSYSPFTHGYFSDLNYTSNDNVFAATSKGAVFKSSGGGNSWSNYSINIESALHNINIINENNILVSGEFGDVWKSTNGGTNWQNKFRDSIGSIGSLCFINSNTGFLCSVQRFLYKSTNAGENWYRIGGAFPHNLYSMLCKDNNNLWITGDSGMILKSTNSGFTWEDKSINTISLIYGIKENNNILFITVFDSENSFYKSTNQGNNWINIPLDSVQYPAFNLNFLNSLIGWITPPNGTIFYKTYNGGNTWIKNHRNDLGLPFGNCHFVNENTGYAVTWSYYNGLIKTTNSGFNWSICSTFVNNNQMTSSVAFLNENTGWVVGDQGFLCKTTNAGSTFITLNNQNIPGKFILSQNYPNPFNPSTIIRFQIKDSRFVTLKVYDILGKEVTTLISEKLKPGEYEATFDGSKLTSGIYFYKLTCGDFTQTKKMLIIK